MALGRLALINITHLVADDGLTCEDLLIRLLVLWILETETKTLLEKYLTILDGADCSHIRIANSDWDGYVSRLIVSRSNQVQDSNARTGKHPKLDTARVKYFQACLQEDPFLDASFLNPIDSNQGKATHAVADSMLKTAQDNGLFETDTLYLRQAVTDFIDVFHVSFSAGSSANITPLKTELTSDARPVRTQLRNYTQQQWASFTDMVNSLLRHETVYPNPTSPLACARLLVPKPAPFRFRFMVYIRPVNKFTVRHQFPMPNLEHELTKLYDSCCYVTFDISQDYWHLFL